MLPFFASLGWVVGSLWYPEKVGSLGDQTLVWVTGIKSLVFGLCLTWIQNTLEKIYPPDNFRDLTGGGWGESFQSALPLPEE